MAGSRMTFVAEFVDRLTGPSTKAKKAVEDLGKATAEAAKKSEQANRRAEGAEKNRASTARKTASDVERAEGRKRRATEETGRTTQRVGRNTYAEWQRGQRAAKDTAAATVRAEQGKRRASQTTAQAIQNHGRRINTTLGGTRSASSRTADAIQQMATRSNRSVGGMQSVMDRVNPGRMASRYNSALGRMLSRTEQVSGKIQGHLDKISNSGAVRGAQVGATVVGGMALTGGARRIADTQQADVVLETMGIDEAGRKELLGQYKGLAQNTPYATGSVAMLGSGLLSAGMSQDDLQGALQGAIDTGALYGMSLDEIGLPLKQIQAKGKAQGDDIMQLTDRGIPIYKWLAEQKGVDQSQVADLVSKGQVSSEDVFAALAANSEGGAEKAAGTLKGSWTNFLSSISQGGEAFLTPLVGPLTDLLKGAKDTITAMKPALSILGEFTAVIVKGITPALPVLIPLVATVTAGIVALAVAAKAALVVKSLATGLGLIARGAQATTAFLGGRGRGRGATGAVGLFTEFLGGMRDGAREAYGQRGLGGLNAGLDTSTKKLGKAKSAVGGLTKGLGLLGGVASGAAVIGGAWGALQGDINTSQGKVDNAAAGGGIDGLNSTVQGAKWNDLSTTNNAFAGNSSHKSANVGEVVAELQGGNFGSDASNWMMNKFGVSTKQSGQKETITQMDSMLAGKVQAGDLAGAGSLFNQIVFQTEAAGKTQQDAMALFPQYKDAVYGVFTQRGQQVDDNAVLAAMRSDKGFRSGGFTGMGAASAPAGVVHGREYVMPESVTSRPGMLPALRQIHRTGEVPRTYHGDTTSVQVNVNAAGATVEAAQAVGQSVEEAVNRVLARRERRAANRHGTRELRGAN